MIITFTFGSLNTCCLQYCIYLRCNVFYIVWEVGQIWISKYQDDIKKKSKGVI